MANSSPVEQKPSICQVPGRQQRGLLGNLLEPFRSGKQVSPASKRSDLGVVPSLEPHDKHETWQMTRSGGSPSVQDG
ncbi:hypothetical protein CGCTS75_v004497 [Colletotrichum tropicale]|nr:hypothetical protein CGCTS75_v004497 [Colletotrichum tropicale]